MLSIDIKLLDERGEVVSRELLEEISESERFRLRTIVAIDVCLAIGMVVLKAGEVVV